MKNRSVFFLFVLILLSALLTVTALAAEEVPAEPMEVYSGSCGDNVTWSLDTATGVLTISGTGAMEDYSWSSPAPWEDYCSDITSVVIEGGVTSIGNYAFYGCDHLVSVTIPGSVTRIKNSAFFNCSALTAITIPASVTSIANGIFSGCTSLKSVRVDENNPVYDSRQDCNTIIETATNTLITWCPGAFIPEGVTAIGDWAFSDWLDLGVVHIPDGITSIGYGAFWGCHGLTQVHIPESVTYIGGEAFWDSVPGVDATRPLEGLVLYVQVGSYAESYAQEWYHTYVAFATLRFTDLDAQALDSCEAYIAVYGPGQKLCALKPAQVSGTTASAAFESKELPQDYSAKLFVLDPDTWAPKCEAVPYKA